MKRGLANPTTWHMEKHYVAQRNTWCNERLRRATRKKPRRIYGSVTIIESQNSFQYESLEIACPTFGWSRLSSMIYVNLDSIIYVYITMGPFHWHGLTLIATWISNYISYQMRSENIHPFRKFNVQTVYVPEWIRYFMPHFNRHMIT